MGKLSTSCRIITIIRVCHCPCPFAIPNHPFVFAGFVGKEETFSGINSCLDLPFCSCCSLDFHLGIFSYLILSQISVPASHHIYAPPLFQLVSLSKLISYLIHSQNERPARQCHHSYKNTLINIKLLHLFSTELGKPLEEQSKF